MLLLDFGVRIPFAPGATVELDEADAAFHQAPREQTVASEDGGLVFVQAIEPFWRPRLFGQIPRSGRLGLHVKSQFVAANAGFQFGVLQVLRQMLLIELGEERQFALLLILADASRRIQIWKWLGCRAEPHALVNRRHESLAPITRAAVDLAVVVAQNGECRQILVLSAQAITDPCAERWPPTQDRAGVHLADPVGMIQPVAPTRTNHRQIINALGDLR